jgi:hypothetical protein
MMGIRRDTFFRDLVRVRVAANAYESQRALFFREMVPAYEAAGKNPDQALEIALENPATYPMFNAIEPISRVDLKGIYTIAVSEASAHGIDRADIRSQKGDVFIQQAQNMLKMLERQGKGPGYPDYDSIVETIKYHKENPRTKEAVSPALHVSAIFLRRLNEKSDSCYKTLTQRDKALIQKVFDSSELREKKIDDLYVIIRKAFLRNYFVNFDKIKAAIEAAGVRAIPRVAGTIVNVHRVVLSYIDSLDRGF